MRELTRQMIKPNKNYLKSVDKAVGYMSNEPHQRLVLKKPRKYKPYIYTDLEYAKEHFRSNAIVYGNNQEKFFLVIIISKSGSPQTELLNLYQHFVKDLQKHKQVVGRFV